MGDILDSKVGVYRRRKELEDAYKSILKLQEEFNEVHIETRKRQFNYGLIRTLELRNMLDIAEVTAYVALWRKESRGAHYTLDYPRRNDKDFLVHSLVFRTKDGLELKTKPVKTGMFEIKERVY